MLQLIIHDSACKNTQTYKDMRKTVPALNHAGQACIILSPVPFSGGLKNYNETKGCKIISK